MIFAFAGGAKADELDTLVQSYPQTLSGRLHNRVIFRDGASLDAGDADASAPESTLLRAASLRDQFLLAYPQGLLRAAPGDDPGRYRNKAFFDAMYGDCRRGEVETRLERLVWLPRSWGGTIEATFVNGVADRLKEVSAEIEALPDPVRRAAYPIAGAYACRNVADAGQPSMHAYGAAIDLNLARSDYWLWEGGEAAHYRNRMPAEIVAAFERHGFIWGGKWRHFDTMHFEYRPELLTASPPLR